MVNYSCKIFFKGLIFLSMLNSISFTVGGQSSYFNGPLRKGINSNYFSDGGGKAILLTGSHTWANFQEIGIKDHPEFDGGYATINLSADKVKYEVSWYIPVLDLWIKGTEFLSGGSFAKISAPFTGAAVLYLRKIS